MKTPTKAEIKKDNNGNKIISLTKKGSRGFSIQTNGNLPETHKMEMGKKFNLASHLVVCWEVMTYIKSHGTDKQKSFLSLSDNFKNWCEEK